MPSLLFLLPQACSHDGPEKPDGSGTSIDRSDGASSAQAASRAAEDEAKLVGIVRLVPSKVQDRLPCTTHVEVQHAVDILAEVPGQVIAVPIQEGQVVERGTILCELNSKEAGLSLETAKNEEKIAETLIDEMDLGAEESLKKIEQARLNLADAKKQLDRATKGVAERLTSTSELENAQLTLDKAKHELTLAEFAARRAALELVKARNQRDQKVLARRIEERKLEKYTIRAPFRGIVPELKVRGGEWVTSSKVLFQLYDSERLQVNITRPQRQFGLLKIGQLVEIQVDAYPDQVFQARIHHLSPVVNMETGSFLVRALIQDPDKKLRPGMFCRADIITRESHQALMIPKIAILYQGDLPHAFVVREGKAHQIEIQPGIELKDSLEALNKTSDAAVDDMNYRPGDIVVIKGKEKLEEGDLVVFREDREETSNPAVEAAASSETEGPSMDSEPKKDSGGD